MGHFNHAMFVVLKTLTLTLTLALAVTLTLTPTLTLTLTLALTQILQSAHDWKVQLGFNDAGGSVKGRPFPSEIAVVSGPRSRPDCVIGFMQTTVI